MYDSRIRNCDVGDNALFSGVRNLTNYVLKEDVLLFDLGTLAAIGESSFGNATRLSVLNEVGGRTLTIFDRLCARVAYLFPGNIRELRSMILNAVTQSSKSLSLTPFYCRTFAHIFLHS